MDLGDTLPFRADVYNQDGGTLTNAQTATLTVNLPDGTTATPAVPAPSSTGKYAVDYPTSTASPQGRYVGQWLFTFAGGATTSYVETFDVGSSLVTLDEALDHLRANDVIVAEADQEKLHWLCLVATEAVELDLRRTIMPRTLTESFNGGYPLICLRLPVLSVTSVVEDGVAAADFLVDSDAGLLYKDNLRSLWSWGLQNVTVTYRAGYNSPPRVVRKVALNAIQGMWQTSQQAPHPALAEFNDVDLQNATATLTPLEQAAYNSLRVVNAR